MAETLPKHYIIAGLFFSLLILGVFYSLNLVKNGSIGDGSDSNPTFMADGQLGELNRTFNNVDQLTSNITELKKKVVRLRPENTLDIISLPVAFVQTAWATMKVMIGMFDFMDGAFAGLSSILGVPEWIVSMISLFVIVLLVFGVLAVIFGKEV